MLPKCVRKCTCGGTATLFEKQGFAWEQRRYYYSCDVCDKNGPVCDDKADALTAWNELNSKSDFDYQPDPCPFCRGEVSIVVCDDEGNIHNEEYEKNPWSGLGYMLYHDIAQVPRFRSCPIARHEGEGVMGTRIYDTRKEAADAWNIRL